MRWGRPVKPTRHGTYRIRLSEEERAVIRNLLPQLGELLQDPDGDPGLFRLFPPAYAEDTIRDAEYQVLMGDELRARRRAQVATVLASAEADELTEPQLMAWMGCLNDLRLVLGTRLDVTEDMEPVDDDDPRAPAFGLYDYLTYLVDAIVSALAESLPDEGADPDR